MKRALVLTLLVGGCGKVNPDIIVTYGRENNSGTYMYFKEHVLNKADFAANVQAIPGTAGIINAVSKDKGAIGYGGIGYVKGVRILKVKRDAATPAVEPSLDNVVSGVYPIGRYLYFYTVGEPQGAVKTFIDWVRSDEGQKICAEVEFYPLPKDKQGPAASLSAAEKMTITMKGSDTMVGLGTKWAEHAMKKNPKLVIQVTGGGSGTGTKALIDGSTHICQASRPLEPKEREQIKAKHGRDPVEFSVAMDGLAVFVHESNALTEISLAQLKDIFTGKVKTWKELAGTKAP